MDDVIQKAAVLIEALPYIQRFRGETVVVKFGGSIMECPDGVEGILQDVAFMECAGLRPVIVHGGGKSISKHMQAQGLQLAFLKGLRVTNEQSMQVVEHVLNHEVNPNIVHILESYGCMARGIHGDDVLKVIKRTERHPQTGEALDWGYVGEIVGVDAPPIEAFLQSGITPVITPMGRGPDKMTYNINADEAAAAIAQGLHARKLVFLSDVPGLFEEPQNEETLISTVREKDVQVLMDRGVINGGMLPKIQGGIKALQDGVRKVHIIDSSLPHSLLLELFTDEGVGTEIIH